MESLHGKLVVKILIDTGSAVTLVREDVWKKVQQSPKTMKAPVHSVVAANGDKLELEGQGEVSTTILTLINRLSISAL